MNDFELDREREKTDIDTEWCEICENRNCEDEEHDKKMYK